MKAIENMMGKKVIIRAERAGVHYGTLAEADIENGVVTLHSSRRIWYWDGAASISQLAKTGTTEPKNCKFTVYVDEILISGVIEVIPCTDDAIKSIEGVKEWKR